MQVDIEKLVEMKLQKALGNLNLQNLQGNLFKKSAEKKEEIDTPSQNKEEIKTEQNIEQS